MKNLGSTPSKDRLDLHSGTNVATMHHTSIATDHDNNVHIAYFHDFADNDLEYMTNSSGNWSKFTVDSEGDAGYGAEIAIDSTDAVHIVYLDLTDAPQLKYANNQPGAWEIDVLSSANTGDLSIAIDSTDRLHVAFADSARHLAYTTNRSRQ